MKATGLMCCLMSLAIAGCASDSVQLKSYEGAPPNQKYEIGEVISRARQLEPGMAKLDVLLRLGSPAERHGDHWLYLPSDPGVLIPQQALVVKFERGRYLLHKKQLVTLGERIILE